MRWLLVVLQFATASILVLTTDLQRQEILLCVALAFPGAALAIWAWIAMGLKKIRITPDVRHNAKLVTSPPYRWVRHPMYTGLLLFALAFLVVDLRIWRVVLLVVLAITLECKAGIEERLLTARFSGYNAYRQRSWKFIPFLY